MKNGKVLGLCAYISLFLTAVCKFLGMFLEGSTVLTCLDTIGDLFLIITVGLAAFPFQRNTKHIAWKVIYWVVIILALSGSIGRLVTIFTK